MIRLWSRGWPIQAMFLESTRRVQCQRSGVRKVQEWSSRVLSLRAQRCERWVQKPWVHPWKQRVLFLKRALYQWTKTFTLISKMANQLVSTYLRCSTLPINLMLVSTQLKKAIKSQKSESHYLKTLWKLKKSWIKKLIRGPISLRANMFSKLSSNQSKSHYMRRRSKLKRSS